MDWTRAYGSASVPLFGVAFLVFAYWETIRPLRMWNTPSGPRWRTHGILLVLSALVPGAILRTSPIALAVALQTQPLRWGLLQQPWMPLWASVVLSFVLIDAALYVIHWVEHQVPVLWRIHKLHHSDLEFDVSTAGRVHPLDAVVQSATVCLMVYVLGVPPEGVMASELLVLANSFWIHSNIQAPKRLLDAMELLVMTPRLHQVHHSQAREDNDSNVGDVLVIWDRIFGTFRAEPSVGFSKLRMGLPEMTVAENLKLSGLLLDPFRRARKVSSAIEPAA